MLPVYANADRMPDYLSKVTTDTSTENFYWSSRLIDALADSCFANSVQTIDRYHNSLACAARAIIFEYDAKMTESGDFALIAEANRKLCEAAKKETVSTLNAVLLQASEHMKNGYNRADN